MGLDLLCLRTFVAIVDGGSFAAGAARVHRSLPAVSQQMERLSGTVGQAVFVRDGRRMVLSDAGHRLLPLARDLLAQEERTLAVLRAGPLDGTLSLGMVHDLADGLLPGALRRLREQHPGVRLRLRIDGSEALAAEVAQGELDMALRVVEAGARRVEPVVRLPMVWLVPEDGRLEERPLPLVVFTGACPFRRAAEAALEGAALPWRRACDSASLSGLKAAVAAGLGVTVRTGQLAGPGVVQARDTAGLPPLPSVAYGIDHAGGRPSPMALATEAALRAALNPVSPLPAG